MYIQCLDVFGCLLQGHGANGQNFGIPLCGSFLGKLMVRESENGETTLFLGDVSTQRIQRESCVILGRKGEGITGVVGEI